jgi:transcriptional regulator with XRE-family HTH domain
MMRDTRKELGWSQQRLARELGIGQGYVCDMEQGRKPVSKRTEMALELLRIRHGLVSKEDAV